MNNQSPFSAEYDINNTTDSQSNISKESTIQKDKEKDDIMERIENEYQLSKPRRNLIRARIIPDD
jgi:hypothetical protein